MKNIDECMTIMPVHNYRHFNSQSTLNINSTEKQLKGNRGIVLTFHTYRTTMYKNVKHSKVLLPINGNIHSMYIKQATIKLAPRGPKLQKYMKLAALIHASHCIQASGIPQNKHLKGYSSSPASIINLSCMICSQRESVATNM